MKNHIAGAVLLMSAAVLNVHASIILLGSQQGQGGGFGGTANFLTVQEVGQDDGTEAGCIAGGAGGTLVSGNCLTFFGPFTGGDEKNPTNPNFNQLVTFSGFGAEGIVIGLNAAEPGGDLSINLNRMVLTLYDAAGVPRYSTSGLSCNGQPNCTAAPGGGITLTTQSGIGNFGFLFGLDSGQAFALNAAGSGRLGLAASFTGYAGGQETFYLVAGPARPPGDVPGVPEPGTWSLMAAGLGLAAVLRLRHR